ncbi:MAG: protocatechuate 3,4-dioxygenase subunit alpha [Bryobacteraceae bacterium]
MIPTSSQTVGPFFNFGLTTNAKLGRIPLEGDPIRLEFLVLDGDGLPTPGDSMIELWQASAAGHYDRGFGRLETDAKGVCVFETVKPGSIGEGHAPHICVTIFARGLLRHLSTRVYFEGEPLNERDTVLALVPEARRATLLARRVEDTWHVVIRLQGDEETVFFDV